MRRDLENVVRLNLQRLEDLKKTTAELERELCDTRVSLERELAEPFFMSEVVRCQAPGTCPCGSAHISAPHVSGHTLDAATISEAIDDSQDLGGVPFPAEEPERCDDRANRRTRAHSGGRRTAVLINHGRRSVYHRRFSFCRRNVAIGLAFFAVLAAMLGMIMARGGASWPPSVATVQAEITKACQNPDVESEPGQVNFACGKTTRQILWVFSLLTSNNNPDFADARTGRMGLEPITPSQGGEVASSLNLHHPYNPTDPIDSLEVAARAINDIVGGATATGANGDPVVQPGLEGDSANCARYTGSAAVVSLRGFPTVCAKPISSAAGQAVLVADIYRKWIVGASDHSAQNAAVLFENANNPGDPQVQSILKHLPVSRPPT